MKHFFYIYYNLHNIIRIYIINEKDNFDIKVFNFNNKLFKNLDYLIKLSIIFRLSEWYYYIFLI